MKIIVRESMCQGVKCVQVSTLSRRCVRESLLCPSASFCEDLLQLKRVTSSCCPVRGATEGLDVKMAKLKRIVGRGPVKGSLLNEDLSLHGTMW
jgi:hypothetical protein